MPGSTHHSFRCGASSSARHRSHAPITAPLERMTGLRKTHVLYARPHFWLKPRRNSLWSTAFFLFAGGLIARAAEPADIQRRLLAGNYAAVIKQATGELKD